MVCADDSLDYVHRSSHRIHVHSRGSYQGLGLGVAQSFYQDVAGRCQAAAAANVAVGQGSGIGIGHVGTHLRCAYTKAGLPGQGVGQGVVLVLYADALDIDLSATAAFHIGAEVAVGSGVDHVHTYGQSVEADALFFHPGLGIAPALGQNTCRLTVCHRHILQIGVVFTVVFCFGHVGFHGDKAYAAAACGFIAVAHGCSSPGIGGVIQLCLYIYGGFAYINALDVCLIGGVQISQQNI